jgi:hypothetical protein
MHQCSVNSDIARAGTRQHLAAVLTVIPEIVERQWPRSRIDVGDNFVDLAVSQDRKNGSEDLFLHDPRLVRCAEHNHRRESMLAAARVVGLWPGFDHARALTAGIAK